MTLGEQVKKSREKMGWSQAVLSERSGVSRFTIQGIEQNRFEPRLTNILKLAKELRATFVFQDGTTELVIADATALLGTLMETLKQLKRSR
jgi:transcriptional regulator with XRE-family HTH domain